MNQQEWQKELKQNVLPCGELGHEAQVIELAAFKFLVGSVE